MLKHVKRKSQASDQILHVQCTEDPGSPNCGAGGNRTPVDRFGECQLVADSAPDLVFREVDVLACAN